MKNVKRAICMVLALVMLVSVFSIGAFADNSLQSKYAGAKLCVLGDSNASAFGLPEYFEASGDPHAAKEFNLTVNGYPYLLAQELGLDIENDVFACSHSAWRTNEFLHTINPDLPKDTYGGYRNDFLEALHFLDYDGSPAAKAEYQRICNELRTGVKDADIITVDFGSNDIYTVALTEIMAEYSDRFSEIGAILGRFSDPSDFLNALFDLFEQRGILGDFINSLGEILTANTESFKRNYPIVIDEIRKLNPNATIVCMGLFCPISLDLRINHEVVFNLRTSSDERVASVNEWMAQFCKENGCVFVDDSHPELYGLGALDFGLLLAGDDDVQYSALTMLHPTHEGHKYIKNQIVAALKAYDNAPVLTTRYSRFIHRSTLNWTPVDGAQKYYIYRSTNPDSGFLRVGVACGDIFYDNIVLIGRTYYYKVVAVMDKYGDVLTEYSNVESLKALI